MQNRLMQVLIIICLGITASCAQTGMATAPTNGSSRLLVYAPPEANSFKVNSGVTLAVENKSDHEIMFLPENAVTLYVKKDDKWERVGNLVTNSIPHKIILSSKDVIESNAMIVSVIPDVSRFSPALIRIDLLGTDQLTHEEIMVSTEIQLKP